MRLQTEAGVASSRKSLEVITLKRIVNRTVYYAEGCALQGATAERADPKFLSLEVVQPVGPRDKAPLARAAPTLFAVGRTRLIPRDGKNHRLFPGKSLGRPRPSWPGFACSIGKFGAGDAIRTRDPNLGKVMLYP